MRDKGAGSVPKNGGKTIKKRGNDAAAKIDANDTYPVNIIVKMATTRQKRKAVGNNASNIPAKVPTPFPPLNPAKIV